MKVSRRLNFTGRKKLKSTEAKFELINGDDGVPTFDAKFSIERRSINPDALLFVEAKCNNTVQRFSFGTYDLPEAPDDRRLNQIDLGGVITFTAKVVDESEGVGRLLASGKYRSVGDEEESNRVSLMVFKSADLGSTVWKMEFQEGEKPVLLINSRIPEAKEKLTGNRIFQGLILPAAFRETLLYYLLDNHGVPDDDSIAKKWLDFAEMYAAEERPGSLNDFAEVHQWVTGVSGEFSRKFNMCSGVAAMLEESE